MSNEVQREEAPPAARADPAPAPAPVPGPAAGAARRASIPLLALALAAALGACILAYLAVAVPGSWFPSASPVAFGVRDLQMSRGTGKIVGDELIVSGTDAAGIAIVSVTTDFRSADYAAIAWIGIDFPDEAQVTLLWQSDYSPGTINTAPVKVESGRPQPLALSNNPKWIGRIKGIALAVRGKFTQPLVLRGAVAKPMGAGEVLGDRVREWFAFEGWTGTSINTVTGGADIQGLPLPLLLAAAIALAAGSMAIVRRVRPQWPAANLLVVAAGFFLVAWLILDARWTVNLARQVVATHQRYGGKSWENKRLASDDGALFEFVQKALKVMPSTPVRVFVAADAPYFRGRAAYHLYPHAVWFDPRLNAIPPASQMRPGDWLLVFQRRGIQYDASQQRLRWDDTQTAPAELRLAGQGAALFQIR
jgi:hypothetical protein